MDQEQALSKLVSIFHEDFLELFQTYIRVDEKLLGAADCAVVQGSFTDFGYITITDSRSILVYYHNQSLFGKRQRILYRCREEPFIYYTGKFNFYWYPPSSKPLTDAEKKGRRIHDYPHSKLKRVETKEDSVRYKGQQVNILELICHTEANSRKFPLLSFQSEVGQDVYGLLLKLLRREIAPTEAPQKNRLISELERLSKLYQDGLLSREQFEAAKNRLIHG